ncbi:MAG: hypothetical protein WC250_01175 [Candidatus Paceibacterota bacterium]|jgi:hypothetical protein
MQALLSLPILLIIGWALSIHDPNKPVVGKLQELLWIAASCAFGFGFAAIICH